MERESETTETPSRGIGAIIDEAMRIAYKETAMLREVMRLRTERDAAKKDQAHD